MENYSLTPGTVQMLGYNYHENRQVLDITSNCGTVYQYFNVPENVITALQNADDQSDYYRKSIRNKFKRMFKAYANGII